MKEVWFIAAVVASLGAAPTDDERIRVVRISVAVLFWIAFGFTELYGRLSEGNTQQKDV